MPLSQGQVLNNRYRIVRLLGQGGFGAVYRAWDMNLNGPCAVKENFDASPEAQKQFAREASLLFNLRHPNLPKVIDHFSLPDQGQYLVMEYIDGEDLEDWMNRSGGPLTEAQVLPWIAQVCDALAYLHMRTSPIIHRDVKPANVRITPEGVAFLVDFGVAKTYDPDRRTTQGARAVTPGYAPFEQYGGRSTDARTDIYALGATLYHALTGAVPPESIDRMAGEPLNPPREINPAISAQVEAAILHAMELQPEGRFRTAADFKTALLAALHGRPAGSSTDVISAQRTSLAPSLAGAPPGLAGATAPEHAMAHPPAGRPSAAARSGGPWLWMILGGVVLAALAALAVWTFYPGSPAATAQPPTGAALVIPTDAVSTSTPEPSPTDPPPAQTSTPLAPTPAPSSATPASAVIGGETPTTPPLAGTALPGLMNDPMGVTMALVPAGEFWMGAADADTQARPDERPRTQLNLPDFYMDVFEVTNRRYAACVEAGSCAEPDSEGWNELTRGDFPVTGVTFSQAGQYCSWRGARLPTEAEWEKAARGGLDSKMYAWGDDAPTCEAGTANAGNYNECGGAVQFVGHFAPNGFGLYDMAGNVWEWVSTRYRPYPYDLNDGREDSAAQTGEVTRGGSWYDDNLSLRVSARGRYQPEFWLVNIGFRCAKSP